MQLEDSLRAEKTLLKDLMKKGRDRLKELKGRKKGREFG